MTDSADKPRTFALNVVQILRDAGFEALWAGGCVRDALMGFTPKDYDVATSATPEQVIEIFGPKKTVPVGVSFGVVMVLGPEKTSGQIEVATFRADGEYLDGRRPASVQYCSAEEDAKRRDFTINGMFYDPLTDEVIDYVGGRKDLEAQVLRAIGSAHDRFTEDKLRMLRAVRFAGTYQFRLEDQTAEGIRRLRSKIDEVSEERISQELRRMLSHARRADCVQRLYDVGLLAVLFPDIFGPNESVTEVCTGLSHLEKTRFEPALAMLLDPLFDSEGDRPRDRTAALAAQCRKMKLSNEENSTVCWIVDVARACTPASEKPLRMIKPLLADERYELLLDYLQANALGVGRVPKDARFLSEYLSRTDAQIIDPVPLVDGRDLKSMGIEPGPVFKQLLKQIRDEQLDEIISTREEALERLQVLNADA